MEESIRSDSGFVVEWQLVDGTDTVIDLSVAEVQGHQELIVGAPANKVSTAR